MDEQELYERLKEEFNPPLSPTLITTLLFDYSPEDPTSLAQIEDTLRVLAHSAQQEQQQQQLLDEAMAAAELDDDDDESVQRLLDEWSISERTGSTPATSVDGRSGGVGEDMTSSRRFLETLFPHLSSSTVEAALAEDPSADLEDVVEYLLSIEIIREANEKGGVWEGDSEAAALQWENMTQAERDEVWEGDAVLNDGSNTGELAEPQRSSSYAGIARSSLRVDSTTFEEVKQVKKKKKKQPTSTKTSLNTLPFNQSHTRSNSASSSSTARSGNPNAFASSSSSSRSSSRPPHTSYLPHIPITNHWATLDSLSQTLSTLLPCAAPALFSSHLHSPSYPSTHTALLHALSVLASQFSDGDDGPRPDMMLEILFGNEDDAKQETRYGSEVDVVWKSARGDLSTALDVWGVMREVEGWGGYKEVTSLPAAKVPLPASPLNSPNASPRIPHRPLPSSSVSTSAFPSLKDSRSSSPNPSLNHLFASNETLSITPPSLSSANSSQSQLDQYSSSSSSSASSPTVITNGAPRSPFPRRPVPQSVHNAKNKWNLTGKDTKGSKSKDGGHRLAESIPAYAKQGNTREGRAERWEELREKEMLERGLRNEALRLATRHFKSGTASNQGGSIAGHYAETARKLSETTRRLGLDAAKAQLMQTRKYTTTYIDLHGLTAYQALSIVREAVHRWWEARTTTPPSPCFTIITGVGRHSPGQKAVLAPAVTKMLVLDGWKISRGREGTILALGAA